MSSHHPPGGSLLGARVQGEVGPFTGGTKLTAECNVKTLCHSHNVWGNEMNSLSGFLLSAVPKNTVLSAQMEKAWFWRRAWYKQASVNTNESLRIRPSLSSDSWGAPEKRTCPCGLVQPNVLSRPHRQFGSQANQKPGFSFPGRSSRRHSPVSCLLFFLPFLVREAWANTNRLIWANSAQEKTPGGSRTERITELCYYETLSCKVNEHQQITHGKWLEKRHTHQHTQKSLDLWTHPHNSIQSLVVYTYWKRKNVSKIQTFKSEKLSTHSCTQNSC